jgi:hypothetical protein
MKTIMPILCRIHDRGSNKTPPSVARTTSGANHSSSGATSRRRSSRPRSLRRPYRWLLDYSHSCGDDLSLWPSTSRLRQYTAFWEDGITTSSDPTQGTAYGAWKKLGPRTYATKIVQVNPDGTLTTIESTSEVIDDEMTATFFGKVTDSTGKQPPLAQFTGTVVDKRITFRSKP